MYYYIDILNLNLSFSDFFYKLTFQEKRIEITNEDNLTKPILNILNVLSLWLSLNLFQTFVFKLKLLFNSKFWL